MNYIPVSRIEAIAADAYNEFYNLNKELFQSNIQEYWFLAFIFKDEKIRNEIYQVNYRNTKDYDPTEDIYDVSSQFPKTAEKKK